MVKMHCLDTSTENYQGDRKLGVHLPVPLTHGKWGAMVVYGIPDVL